MMNGLDVKKERFEILVNNIKLFSCYKIISLENELA